MVKLLRDISFFLPDVLKLPGNTGKLFRSIFPVLADTFFLFTDVFILFCDSIDKTEHVCEMLQRSPQSTAVSPETTVSTNKNRNFTF